MTITKHAKQRLSERFKVKSDSEINRVVRKLDRDFIKLEEEEGKTLKTIIWKEMYLVGVIKEGVLVTVVNKGFTNLYFLRLSNPQLSKGKDRYRNKQRRAHVKKAIYR